MVEVVELVDLFKGSVLEDLDDDGELGLVPEGDGFGLGRSDLTFEVRPLNQDVGPVSVLRRSWVRSWDGLVALGYFQG